MKNMIETKNLTKTYKALRKVVFTDFSVQMVLENLQL